MDIIKAIFIGGLPVALAAFGLVYWSIKKGYMSVDDSLNILKETKKESKQQDSTVKLNPIHKKWLLFGGGYYGTMAFITYIHLEILEIKDFFAGYTSFSNLVDHVSFGAVIQLIIESFLNLIPAFVWFSYWPKIFTIQNGWYWLIASYLGYQIGSSGARLWIKRNPLQNTQ